jgi:opacity protein-like surface antigen
MQGSLLLFVVRRTLAPYVLGGAGIYSQTHETLNATGLPTVATTERRMGWHLGGGAEILVTRRAALFADYRFRFVRFGEPTNASQEMIHIPGTTIIPALEKVKLSHEGSMWTGGVAFYF